MRFQMGPQVREQPRRLTCQLRSSHQFQFRREIPVEHITNPSGQQPIGEVLRLDTSLGWRNPIIAYLKDGTLLDDRVEARKLQHMATRYVLLEDILYKKSYTNLHPDPYLRCLSPKEARKVMQEIYKGDCGNPTVERSLAHKVINLGTTGPRCSTMPRIM